MPTTIPTLCGSFAAHPYSLAVKVHNAAYRALGVDYTFVYFGVEHPRPVIEAMRYLGIRGLNVSMPFKSEVMAYLDEIESAAQKIGAVNAISNTNSKLIGYNTDWIGAVKALSEISLLRGSRSVILGSGGAAKAIAYGLKESGSDVVVYNRSMDKAQNMVTELGVQFGGSLQDFKTTKGFDIIVNATSVGFRGIESPVDANVFDCATLVMDAVFIPVETTFLKYARDAGCRVINGTKMFLYQACEQVEIYTGYKAPIDIMEQIINQELQIT